MKYYKIGDIYWIDYNDNFIRFIITTDRITFNYDPLQSISIVRSLKNKNLHYGYINFKGKLLTDFSSYYDLRKPNDHIGKLASSHVNDHRSIMLN